MINKIWGPKIHFLGLTFPLSNFKSKKFVTPTHNTSSFFHVCSSAISVFIEDKEGSAFRHSQKNFKKMCSGFESIETCLVVNTYNQSELLHDVFLGFTRKKSLTTPNNLVTEELARPSFGRYYTIKPSFKITTDWREHQMFLSLNRSLNYVVHVFDPSYYIGFYNPSLPIVKKWVQPDETAGWFHSLILTEVRPSFSCRCDSIFRTELY